MELKKTELNREKFCYASPLEIRHYVLDIPVTKAKYQYNAVKFALRALYPGNEETTVIDYVARKNSIIGIAANSERISRLKEENELILSPALLVSQLIKNGIVIYAGKGWLELQAATDGFPLFLQSYSERQFKLCLQNYSKLVQEYNFSSDQKIVYLFDSADDNIIEKFKENQFEVRYIKNHTKSVKLNDASIFIERKNKINLLPLFISALVVLCLSVWDILLYQKSNNLNEQLVSIKQKYQTEKKQSFEKSALVTEDEFFQNEVFSSYDIFKEIYKTSASIRILSFSMNGDVIKFEAEKASAIKVLDELSKSQLFQELVLHQSLPQDDGSERFVISGKIKR